MCPDRAAEALVDAANRAGGIDNITVVLFEILGGAPLPEPEPVSTPEPDEHTAENAVVASAAADVPDADLPAVPPVHRHGAGGGGRWLALCVILLTLAMASVIIWWSLAR